MDVVHFLNVNNGDCSLIQHNSGRNTVIDVCNASIVSYPEYYAGISVLENFNKSGNYNQKSVPVNPIEYFKKLRMDYIFRFILTHPDMDHMDGLKKLFTKFKIVNFWDTNNNKKLDNNTSFGNYNKKDWDYYQKIRKSSSAPTVLHLLSNAHGEFYNEPNNGDGLYILAPNDELVKQANDSKEYNDASYVILFKTSKNKKIIFSGDSGKKTWDYILANFKDEVSDVDVLLAPHHGRKSGGNDEFLDILKPKLTLFGNAKSKDLDYNSWNNRNLKKYTNNQAGTIILEIDDDIKIYCTNEKFARGINSSSYYNYQYEAWLLDCIE